ncbi:hypothetical protein ACV229_15850 [Burkholderia sp. MR1-5-21]
MPSDSEIRFPHRKFVQAVGTTVRSGAIDVPMVTTSGKAPVAGNFTVGRLGTNSRQGVEETLSKPLYNEFGVHVTFYDTPGFAAGEAQVMTNNVQWDVFDGIGAFAMTGSKNGYWVSKVTRNDVWWTDHYDDLTQRFKEWASS